MNISENEAIKIATEFAQLQRKQSNFPLKYDSANAVFNSNTRKVSYINIDSAYWSVFFPIDFAKSEIAAMDPDHVIVVVSAEDGAAEWYPLI